MISKEVVVIKLGGSVLNQLHPTFYHTCNKLIQQGTSFIIVHGGGASITDWMQRVGKEPQFIEGRRVTDEESLSIVTSILGGKINKQLVTSFEQAGAAAIGLSGIDLGILKVKPVDEALGYVGEVTEVQSQSLSPLLEQGWIPVVASLGVDEAGQHYNVNADEAASALAQAVGAKKLLMVSDVDGVLNREGELVERIDAMTIQHDIEKGGITGGMIPKLRASLTSLRGDVGEVWIINGEKPWPLRLEELIGTRVVKEGDHSDVIVSKLSSI